MAHPTTNGASLEDCHTNFFALTDLCGIRWRKLTSEGYSPQSVNTGGGVYQQRGLPGHPQPSEYLNDPVLSSYWRCLSNDILCVWRRIPHSAVSSPGGNAPFQPGFGGSGMGLPHSATPSSSNGLHSLSGAKELWIFWYGDTPPDLANLVVPEILSLDGEQGSWENGLTYECRSLLFKALHNLIERCLLSRNFVRLGKWFIQPQQGFFDSSVQHVDSFAPKGASNSSSHLSFSFSFFVHGESTVCASIDVRQHPVVRRITHRHLSAAQSSSGGVHVLLAPYGLAGTLTGNSYRASTDPLTRKLMDEWRQYYPIDGSSGSASTQRGPGPGGGSASLEPAVETEDMVEVIVGNVRARYPACYTLVCDADAAVNAHALSNLAASEGAGLLMTPPSSPPSNPAALNRSNSHSSAVSIPTASHQTHSGHQQQIQQPLASLPTIPKSTASAMKEPALITHSWRPEEAGRLAQQAWDDSLLSPTGLSRPPSTVPTCSSAAAATCTTTTATTDASISLWDFIDPVAKSSCICIKSRRSKSGNSGNSLSSTLAKTSALSACTPSSSTSSSTFPSSSSSSVSSSNAKRGIPFHLRPSFAAPPRAGLIMTAADKDAAHPPGTGTAEGVHDRPCRNGTVSSTSSNGCVGTPAPTPTLPTYQRSQAALRGPSSQQPQTSASAHNTSGNSVGPCLASPASVAPSPLPTPHSHAPNSVPPMDSSLPLPSPHPPASNDAGSSFIPSTPLTSDHQHSSSLEPGNRATPGGAAHTPGGPKSNTAYSPYVAIPSVDTPGWPHSSGPVQRAAMTTASKVVVTGNMSTAVAELGGMKKIVLPIKEYEQDLKEDESNAGLLYDYSSMTAWLFHPVKRLKFGREAVFGEHGESAANDPISGALLNGRMANGNSTMDYDGMDTGELDDESQSRKRKEPDSKDDDGVANAASAAAKQANPGSLYTTEGLQPSSHDLDNIFDNSDESNDTCPVPTPPGSNKPAGLSEDSALPVGRPRITPAHPSPGSTTVLGNHLTAGGVNILASAELSKMFPTPPSHEHPMQSPCGQMEGTVELGGDNSSGHNGVKGEPNGCSPTYAHEDTTKDWSYVYRPPTVWKLANSAKYAPLPMLPSQAMPALFLPTTYRPSAPVQLAANEINRPVMAMRSFPARVPSMVPPSPHFPRPASFSPMSPSPFLDGTPSSFGGGAGQHGITHGVQRPGIPPMGFPPHNTLKQLLQHQQSHPHPSPFPQHPSAFQHSHQPLPLQSNPSHQHGQTPQQQHSNLPECHALMMNIVLADSMLNVFRDHNFDSCAVCVCSDGQNWVGTIRGPDAVLYLPEPQSQPRSTSGRAAPVTSQPHQQYPGMGGMGGPGGFMPPPQPNQQQEEESCRCNCGFSALVNRRLSHQAGLFYEDELEIAGPQSTQDPAQFKRGSLYAFCHSENEDQLVLARSRLLDYAFLGTGGTEGKASKNLIDKEVDKGDMVSSTIAAVVREATAPSVDTLPVALMELLREQCLLLHHASSPLYRAEQLQAATRKTSVLHSLELSDSCDTARNALTLALYHSPPPLHPPLSSPLHAQQQQAPPPYHQQQQPQWSAGPPTPNPYMASFNTNIGPGFPPSGTGGFPANANMHPPPMSPNLHSPTMPVRGRPPTPATMNMQMGLGSPVGMSVQRPPSTPSNVGPAQAPPPAGPVVHYWPFLHAQGPSSSHDVVRVMRTLQPLLQESIQKKRAASLWRAPFAVQGPLTWRQFHRMAVRGTEDRCEPQPIPSVIAGYDRDWVAIAPLAIPHWDRLLLEPYSRPRDVAYIVLVPEVDYVLARTKHFFKELSSTYEMCRFGRHVPITKNLRDGMLRVGKSAASKLANDPVDDWFTNIGDSAVANLIRLYAKVCKYHLAPTLISMPMDRTLLDPPAPPSRPPAQTVPSPMAPPPTTPIHPGEFAGSAMGPPNPAVSAFGASHPTTMLPAPDASGKPTSPKAEEAIQDGASSHATTEAVDDEDAEPPSVVIYIVDPFSFASDSLDLGRLTTLGLLRCYHQMLSLLPESAQLNVSLQLVSAESILQLGKNFSGASRYDSLRSLALNVFSQCKKLPHQPSNVKSLTGFGPAAQSDSFLKSKDEKNRAPFRVYIPAYILAPMKDRTVCDLDPSVSTNGGPVNGAACSVVARPDKFAVLYVSYCLSEDQRWLIAACTDERGELVDSCTIGIDVPNRSKRKRVSVRRFGLQRLMDFILGVISTGVHPWRLVIGRLGRMGHGELKSWSSLLSRKNLLRASRHLAEICGQCSLMFPSQAPTLVSACLVSLEPDSHFRMMPDQVTPDERFGQQSANSHLSTPEDASCTHILVFPTSATTRSPQTTFHEENINGPDLGDDDLLSALNDDMGDGFEGMTGFDEIFMTWPETDPVNDGADDLTSDITGGNGGSMNNMGSCGTSRSPGAPHGGPPSPSGRSGMRSNMPESPVGMGSGRQSPRAEQEEVGTLLQQPLALGYYVSTAPIGDMPSWFWASCPHLSRTCPAFLKCALHLHNHAVQPGSDDLLLQQQQQQVNNSSKVHPLDSQVTTDVLRYVMEGYNALSWLSLDPKSRDRRSCLPIHIQLLVQLYHALSALV